MVTPEEWMASTNSTASFDRTLSFVSPILQAAFQTWSAMAGSSIPSRHDLTARAVKDFVSNIIILERIWGKHYRIRLMGTRITSAIGEMQGKCLHEALRSDVARRWTLALDRVLRTLRPIRIVNRVILSNHGFLEAEILLAPLLDEGHHPTMVFSAVAFQSGIAVQSKVDAVIGFADGANLQPLINTKS